MTKDNNQPKEINAPDEDTIVNFKLKQLYKIGAAVVVVIGLITGGYAVYSNMENRLANMEADKSRFQSVVRAELPELVEKEVRKRLKRDNQIVTLLNDYTCDELALHVSDLKKIIDLKNCPQ
ncbi:hypothetical protein [Neolewinella agarilytica]|uniref:Uncharacterized protein n=1 Tax=Neolewinella agarilytica TaxID=478744 RepID=A0A1H9LZC1_9BACT|nr:hypothetical protein [Neolewinella agarilytica]SER16768.1 hypothetical protein SAMN05444359_12650 [Neolewinella agarilytica]